MKTKAKIVITSLSMAITLGVIVFAIYAAVIDVSIIENTMSIHAGDVYVRILGNVMGAKSETIANSFYQAELLKPEMMLQSWNIGDKIEFHHIESPIKILVVIQNLSQIDSLSLELLSLYHKDWNGVNISDSNITRFVRYRQNAQEYIYDGERIDMKPDEELVIEITLAISNIEKESAFFNNSFEIALTNLTPYQTDK